MAHRVVERVLREALADTYTGDISFWPTTRVGDMLPTSDLLENFWLLLLDELRQRRGHQDRLEFLIVQGPQGLREKTGDEVVDLIAPFFTEIFLMEKLASVRTELGDERFDEMADPSEEEVHDERFDEMEEPSEEEVYEDPLDAEPIEEAAPSEEIEAGSPPAPASAPPSPAKNAPKSSEDKYRLNRVRQPHPLDDPFAEDANGSVPAVPAPDPNASLVRVFYATDRLQTHVSADGPEYDHERSKLGVVQYGECEISIPKTHKTGKLESPSFLRFEFRPDPKKHIVLTKTLSLDEDKFFEEVNLSVTKSATKEAFVFIHGYNVSFEAAARRTGQMAYDLQFVGAPIFYSWPSNDRFADYLKDETNITWSTPHFQSFLSLLAQRSGAERIHIIAHSMGNRAVCDALKALSHDPESHLKFNHLVLAAPDIDAETFAELATTLQRLSGRVTLYESSNDKALQASKKIHGYARAGEPLLIVPGMDTIDASKIDTDFLGHSYFSDNWPLLSDIHWLLAEDKPPKSRFGLEEMEDPKGKYYVFRG